jgi:hypothetical protein
VFARESGAIIFTPHPGVLGATNLDYFWPRNLTRGELHALAGRLLDDHVEPVARLLERTPPIQFIRISMLRHGTRSPYTDRERARAKRPFRHRAFSQEVGELAR